MKAVSTNDDFDQYVPIQESSLCIGYDGLGAVDGVKSDVTSMVGNRFSENPIPEEMRLADVKGTPQICMRRAVRRFDLYYGDKHDLLILSDRAFALAGLELEASVEGFTSAECHFGAWSGHYRVGKLRRKAALYDETVNFRDSSFVEVKSLSHHQSLVERGERDMMDESRVLRRGLRFGNSLEVMKAEVLRSDILLEEATLNFPKVAMFGYKAGVTYLRLSIYRQLLNLKQPQRQVLGIVGSQPFARLHFASGGGEMA